MAAGSQIRIWQSSTDHITFDYAQLRVHYSEQGERIRDRLGLIHRISPSVNRYPTGLTLSILAEELTRINAAGAGTRRNALDWLEVMYTNHAQLTLYAKGDTLDDEGQALSRWLYYTGWIDGLPPEYFGTLPKVGDGPEYAEFAFTVVDDGTFSNFESLAGATPSGRP